LAAPSDENLVQAVIGGDKAAYGELYDRYAPLVRAICYGTAGNLQDAQDMAQDVFLRAYGRLCTLRDPARFGKWLISIANMRCKECRRQKARSRQTYLDGADFESPAPAPSNNGQIDKLRKLITELPKTEQLALHVFYLQERSADDGCRTMGLSRSGFYRVLSRARDRLQRRMAAESKDLR